MNLLTQREQSTNHACLPLLTGLVFQQTSQVEMPPAHEPSQARWRLALAPPSPFPSRSRSRSLSPARGPYHTPQMGGENSAFKALSHQDTNALKALSHQAQLESNALKALSQTPFEGGPFKPHPALENSAFKALVPHSAAAALLAAQSIQLARGYESHSDSDEEINVHDESDDDGDRQKNKTRSRSPSPCRQRALTSSDLPLQLTKHDR
ncbi:unnamed protein product [Parnassius apollo]|uniref:(apollo) hypothetical protein n=1 Tax=Parnassius apollo TaxID=110799 RepID=A0A8S3WK04_PARAO|nr:unnamed protein product [Parnassius apollo]